jgi:aminoglycoside phosphotransferase (APT) family kinase protein
MERCGERRHVRQSRSARAGQPKVGIVVLSTGAPSRVARYRYEPAGGLMRGRASTVTDLGDGTVLRTGGAPDREAELMSLAQAHGFPVPRVHAVRPEALVLERIAGPTMGDDVARRPWRLGRHMRTLAALHERLHRIPFEGGALVHFDLHPDNVLLSRSGPVVIDWTNAHGGEPAADVAMTWLILETSAGLPGRLAARVFVAAAGRDLVRLGLPAASAFRVADPNVTPAERERVGRVRI